MENDESFFTADPRNREVRDNVREGRVSAV